MYCYRLLSCYYKSYLVTFCSFDTLISTINSKNLCKVSCKMPKAKSKIKSVVYSVFLLESFFSMKCTSVSHSRYSQFSKKKVYVHLQFNIKPTIFFYFLSYFFKYLYWISNIDSKFQIPAYIIESDALFNIKRYSFFVPTYSSSFTKPIFFDFFFLLSDYFISEDIYFFLDVHFKFDNLTILNRNKLIGLFNAS